MPLGNPVPLLSIRIPSTRIEDVEQQFDEVDPDWRYKIQFITAFWSWTIIVRLPESIYDILISDEDYLQCVKDEVIEAFYWKSDIRFEVF